MIEIGLLSIFVFYIFILLNEYIRVKTKKEADSITIFLIYYYIQIVIPSAVFTINFFFFSFSNTGNFFFDKVLSQVDELNIFHVNSLGIVFLLTFYVVCNISLRSNVIDSCKGKYFLIARKYNILLLTLLGLLSGVYLVLSLSNGQGFFKGYANLISFRALSESVERNFVNSNLFSLTQSFLLISILSFFCFCNEKCGFFKKYIFIILIITLALFCVSRRSFLIPFLMVITTRLLYEGKLNYIKYLKVLGLLSVIVIFGKDLLSIIAGSRTAPLETDSFSSWEFLVKLCCDVGITVVESFATVMFMSDYYRYGLDHMVSILQIIPEGIIGFEMNLPERIVRVSTEIFTDANQADIPPGFLGQMWLDYRYFGPVMYAFIFSVGILIIEFSRISLIKTMETSSFFALVMFIFCLPINSGSFDFNFSVDIIFVTVLIPLMFGFKKSYSR